MGSFSDPRGTEPAKNAPTILHFSFLDTVESTAIKAEIRTDRGCKGPGPRLSTFDVSTSTHDTANLRISACPDLHLVMTF